RKDLLITYQVDILQKPDSKLDEMMKNISEDAFGEKIASFSLSLKKGRSSFILNNEAFIDQNVRDIFTIKTGYRGPTIYKNDSLLTFMKKGLLKKDYVLSSSINNYTVTNERKVISGYNCFKATAIKTVENSAGTFNHKIVVWFTPELPYQSGPLYFVGVPGLVLEAHTKDCVFYASKIEFKEKVDIYSMPNAEVITELQFAQML
ncbi:MAG: GLPGLI family protein, partial [Bacteroidota bacterium]|nr:GLPGLI family protein [Bacteroidota bacterium]